MFETPLWMGLGISIPCSVHTLGCSTMHWCTLDPNSFEFLVKRILLRNIRAEKREPGYNHGGVPKRDKLVVMDVYVRFLAYSMCLVPVLFVCTTGQKEPFVTVYEACNGVILKPLNRTFCCVHTTIVRFYQLYYCFLVFTVFLDCLGSYIFNYIENRFEILFSQLCYVVLECCFCWFIIHESM